LLSIYMCIFDTNISAGTYLPPGLITLWLYYSLRV